MDILRKITQDQMQREFPSFRPGDTLRVHVLLVDKVEGGKASKVGKAAKAGKERSRPQVFEGVCIRRRNHGISSTFTVRKISSGIGVERVFPLYSPRVDRIEVIRRGKVRRAKLYFLRARRGKAARLKELRYDTPKG